MSLGRCYAGHSLDHKLAMAAKHGMQGIELFYEDLADVASSLSSSQQSSSTSNLLEAASYVHDLCVSLNLEIICLQPFMHYEGLRDRRRHAERIEEMKVWIQLAKVLNTDIIQVPSSFISEEECSGDVDLIVSDLRELADMGLKQSPTIRFAYESLSWGTHVDRWEQCWDIIQRVDRTNFGICLDSFNILGRIYADPTSDTRRTPNAEEEVAASIQRLVQQIGPHKEKIFFIQIVDAEYLSSPLRPGHPFYNPAQPSRMSWSRNCRLFYGETEYGAYLPVRDVAHAIMNDIGYDGWISMELFNRAMERTDTAVVEELASRAGEGWRKFVVDMGLEGTKRLEVKRKDSGQAVFTEAIEEVARL